jgi:hypothetical protein
MKYKTMQQHATRYAQVLVISILATGCGGNESTKWEYAEVQAFGRNDDIWLGTKGVNVPDGASSETMLQAMGIAGWELVTTKGSGRDSVYVFRRKLKSAS